MASLIQLHTFVFARLHWISLLYCCGDIYYWEICLCVVNHSLQIYLSYSKNLWVFHPPCLEGFPRVYIASHGLLIYMDDLWRWFIWMIYEDNLCGWYIYEIHMCLIYSYVVGLWDTNVLKFIDKSFKVQASSIFHKHQQIKPPTPLRP